MGFKYILDYDLKNNSDDDYKNRYEENLDNEYVYSPEDSKTTDSVFWSPFPLPSYTYFSSPGNVAPRTLICSLVKPAYKIVN